MHCKEEITVFYNKGARKYSLEKSTTKKVGGAERQDEKNICNSYYKELIVSIYKELLQISEKEINQFNE